MKRELFAGLFICLQMYYKTQSLHLTNNRD